MSRIRDRRRRKTLDLAAEVSHCLRPCRVEQPVTSDYRLPAPQFGETADVGNKRLDWKSQISRGHSSPVTDEGPNVIVGSSARLSCRPCASQSAAAELTRADRVKPERNLGAAKLLTEKQMNPRPSPAQVTEPPYADPHVRWCGRGGAVRLPPIPICRKARAGGSRHVSGYLEIVIDGVLEDG